jgi:hypothetical protein
MCIYETWNLFAQICKNTLVVDYYILSYTMLKVNAQRKRRTLKTCPCESNKFNTPVSAQYAWHEGLRRITFYAFYEESGVQASPDGLKT